MKLLTPGTALDGFVVGECVHAGGMAHIYRVTYADDRHDPGFPMVMKVPRMTAGDGAETIVGFEIEHQLLEVLTGPHVPRFVAAGDLTQVPYIVMERIEGRTLESWLRPSDHGSTLPPDEIARLGSALAHALHSLHRQNVCHHDIKPGNVLIRPDGTAVLLDFGLSCHADFPDLLAEELRLAVGSPAWIAPEQVVGVRGDPRSDLFAVGVVLYELATGELPFGEPQTTGGLRQRLWMDPKPPRALRPDLPPWLQEVLLRCLEPVAADRHPSAAHLAFELSHPEQVHVTERGQRTRGTSLRAHAARWFRAAGRHYQPSPKPAHHLQSVPILMVAIAHTDVSDATLYSLRETVARQLHARPGARLACVTVIPPLDAAPTREQDSETHAHRRQLARLMQWAQPLDVHPVSCHVLEASDVAHALVRYAQGNHVDTIVMGAATHGLPLQRWVSTVPIKVSMSAPCTVILVKPHLPFERLAD